MKRLMVGMVMAAGLASGCAHHQPTNRQLGYGVAVGAFVVLIIVAASASHCEENNCLDGISF